VNEAGSAERQSLDTASGPASAGSALAASLPQPSPGGRGGSRDNNFDFLRLFAALMVIYGHGWVLSTNAGPGFWGVPFARIGLDIFFSISGYMVTGSWLRTPDLRVFLQKRALRILPGLAACVLVTVLVLGARLTRLPLGTYLINHNTIKYLNNIILHPALYLPGVFVGLGLGGAVNGSLWSLFPEALCYLTVPAFALIAIRPRLWALGLTGLLAGTAGLWLFYGYDGEAIVLNGTDVKYMLVEVPFFLLGGLCRLLEDRIAGFYRADFALLGYSLNWMVSSWYSWWDIPVEWVTLPYMALCFGRMSMPVVRRAGRFGDLSYGMYLYAFPVQQVILGAAPRFGYPILACMALTVPFAALSWHLVEKPALRWKPGSRKGSTVAHDTRVAHVMPDEEPVPSLATITNEWSR
jgi:peptidoglycan/LPS O-acetylase OafA/YrhL